MVDVVNFGLSSFESFFGTVNVAKSLRKWRVRFIDFFRLVFVVEFNIFI